LTAERVERRLAAVLAADVAGYSRLMGADEEGTLARLKAVRKTLVDPAIASHRGRVVKTTGDGMLVEFASAVDAAPQSGLCALDQTPAQRGCSRLSLRRCEHRRATVRRDEDRGFIAACHSFARARPAAAG
jgi:class 3 adenylate cyclase